jgi:hypothetical protein
VRIACKMIGSGKFGAGNEGSIERMKATECKVIKGTCGSPTVEVVHLPWATELVEVKAEGIVRDEIKNGGAGAPGWKTTCTVIIKVTDTCEGDKRPAITNNVSEGLVEATFDRISKSSVCSQSKKESGTVEGTLKFKQVGGGGVRVGSGYVRITPKPFDFGSLKKTEKSAAQIFTLKNITVAEKLKKISVSVVPAKPAGNKVFVEENNKCPGELGTPAKTCTLEVRFVAGNEAKGRYTARVVAQFENEAGRLLESTAFIEGTISN